VANNGLRFLSAAAEFKADSQEGPGVESLDKIRGKKMASSAPLFLL
jgi:hypothetical protein